jgi:hypothetical protein
LRRKFKWITNISRRAGIAQSVTGYGLNRRGPIHGKCKRILYSPQRPDWLWGLLSLLRSIFPVGQSGQGLNLTTPFHPVPRSRMTELYLHSPIGFHGIVLNELTTGISLLLPYTSWSNRPIFLQSPAQLVLQYFYEQTMCKNYSYENLT